VLGKLELLARASHEAVEEWLIVVNDDVPRYAIPIYNVRPDEVKYIFLFLLPLVELFLPIWISNQ